MTMNIKRMDECQIEIQALNSILGSWTVEMDNEDHIEIMNNLRHYVSYVSGGRDDLPTFSHTAQGLIA